MVATFDVRRWYSLFFWLWRQITENTKKSTWQYITWQTQECATDKQWQFDGFSKTMRDVRGTQMGPIHRIDRYKWAQGKRHNLCKSKSEPSTTNTNTTRLHFQPQHPLSMDCRDVAKIITVHTENRKFFLFLVVEASECAIPRPDDIDHVPNFDPQRTQHCLSHCSRDNMGTLRRCR